MNEWHVLFTEIQRCNVLKVSGSGHYPSYCLNRRLSAFSPNKLPVRTRQVWVVFLSIVLRPLISLGHRKLDAAWLSAGP